MAAERWRVFLDTNVLIAGLLSRTGASAAILDLAEAEEIVAVVTRQVLVEADRVFLAKFPQLLDRYRKFIQNLSPLLADDPAPQMVREAREIIEADDAPILAAARQEQVDYLVTLNSRDFHTSKSRFQNPVLQREGRGLWPGQGGATTAYPNGRYVEERQRRHGPAIGLRSQNKGFEAGSEVRSFLPCPIVTPSEFLFAFRRFWEQAS